MSFPARWNEDGLVFDNTGHVPPPLRPRTREWEPLDVGSVTSIALRWREVTALEAIEPWPHVKVVWYFNHARYEERIVPLRIWGRGGPLAFEQGAEALFAYAGEILRPAQLRRGWLDEPIVEWELCSDLPGHEPPPEAAGAYRTAAARVVEPIVARRAPLTPFEAMLCWLASGPGRPWQDTPREVVLTEEHLYARRRDRRAWRLPLSELRVRYGEAASDAFYVFGRRTMVILPGREGCPVRARLDELLEE